MRRLTVAAAALAACLLSAACGSSAKPAPPPPQGPPSARHPASDISAALTGEEMRAHLLVAARLYANGNRGFAATHVAAARGEYATISAAVRSRDPVLDREFHAAFDAIDTQIRQKRPPSVVTLRMGLMQGQLLDAAIQDSVSKAARNDPGVGAEVMLRLAQQGAREYAVAARAGFTGRGRLAAQNAFGLIARASTLSHRMSDSLGPQSNPIVNALNNAHSSGFPKGITVPHEKLVPRVTADVERVRQAVQKRFAFVA